MNDWMVVDELGRTPLHRLAELGDDGALTRIDYRRGVIAQLDQRLDDAGRTALVTAVDCGHVPFVERLVKAGADANGRDGAGRTPLAVAAAAGDAEMVRTLLTLGACASAKNQNGRTPLMLAARANSVACVETLLDDAACEPLALDSHGRPAVLQTSDRLAFYALFEAVDSPLEYSIASLSDGVSVMSRASIPLMDRAIRLGCLSAIDSLTRHGVAPDLELMVALNYAEALHHCLETQVAHAGLLRRAVTQQRLACVKVIVRRGAGDVSCDARGRNALALATERLRDNDADSRAIFELVAGVVDADAQNVNGQTPLMLATTGSLNGFLALLAISEDGARDRLGRDAAHYAAAVDDSRFLSALIEDGHRVNRADDAGLTPLAHAVYYDRAGAVVLLWPTLTKTELLLNARRPPVLKSVASGDALSAWAVHHNSRDCIALLIDRRVQTVDKKSTCQFCNRVCLVRTFTNA